jgi:hypothetical protein
MPLEERCEEPEGEGRLRIVPDHQALRLQPLGGLPEEEPRAPERHLGAVVRRQPEPGQAGVLHRLGECAPGA